MPGQQGATRWVVDASRELCRETGYTWRPSLPARRCGRHTFSLPLIASFSALSNASRSLASSRRRCSSSICRAPSASFACQGQTILNRRGCFSRSCGVLIPLILTLVSIGHVSSIARLDDQNQVIRIDFPKASVAEQCDEMSGFSPFGNQRTPSHLERRKRATGRWDGHCIFSLARRRGIGGSCPKPLHLPLPLPKFNAEL